MAETILLAIALKFALLPVAGWGGSLLALRGRPSGARSFVGIGCAVLGGLGGAYFAYGLGHVVGLDGLSSQVLISPVTLLLIIAHIARFASARRLRRPPGPTTPSLTDRLRKLWRYM